MKTLLSLLAAFALAASTGTAFAQCGDQSAKVQQTVASNATVIASDGEAASTFEPQTIKKPVAPASGKPAQ